MTQEKDLDEFLNTAQLAGTEFTAGTMLLTVPHIFLAYFLVRASEPQDNQSFCELIPEPVLTFRARRNIHAQEAWRK